MLVWVMKNILVLFVFIRIIQLSRNHLPDRPQLYVYPVDRVYTSSGKTPAAGTWENYRQKQPVIYSQWPHSLAKWDFPSVIHLVGRLLKTSCYLLHLYHGLWQLIHSSSTDSFSVIWVLYCPCLVTSTFLQSHWHPSHPKLLGILYGEDIGFSQMGKLRLMAEVPLKQGLWVGFVQRQWCEGLRD